MLLCLQRPPCRSSAFICECSPNFCFASIINTIGPSLRTFGALNRMGVGASYVWRQIGNCGQNRPHDAHDAGSWGAARTFKICYLHCMTSMRQALRALPRPNPLDCACVCLPLFPTLLLFLCYDFAPLEAYQLHRNVASKCGEKLHVGPSMVSLRRNQKNTSQAARTSFLRTLLPIRSTSRAEAGWFSHYGWVAGEGRRWPGRHLPPGPKQQLQMLSRLPTFLEVLIEPCTQVKGSQGPAC